MPYNINFDSEFDSRRQTRGVIFWGCLAIVAATAAFGSRLYQANSDTTQLAALQSASPSSAAGFVGDKSLPETDNFVTGSIPPKNTDSLSAANKSDNTSFGTTIAERQSNADDIRRMRTENPYPENAEPSNVIGQTPTGSMPPEIAPDQQPIGINLGTGTSFSVLGKRYSALVNAAPTLFSELQARASIVESNSTIEAHLVAGPVRDIATAKQLCDKIRQRVNTPCTPAKFTGRVLKLY